MSLSRRIARAETKTRAKGVAVVVTDMLPGETTQQAWRRTRGDEPLPTWPTIHVLLNDTWGRS